MKFSDMIGPGDEESEAEGSVTTESALPPLVVPERPAATGAEGPIRFGGNRSALADAIDAVTDESDTAPSDVVTPVDASVAPPTDAPALPEPESMVEPVAETPKAPPVPSAPPMFTDLSAATAPTPPPAASAFAPVIAPPVPAPPIPAAPPVPAPSAFAPLDPLTAPTVDEAVEIGEPSLRDVVAELSPRAVMPSTPAMPTANDEQLDATSWLEGLTVIDDDLLPH